MSGTVKMFLKCCKNMSALSCGVVIVLLLCLMLV